MFSLQGFVERTKERGINMDAVMVVQEGVVLGLHRFSDDVIHNVFSVAKSYTSTAIGMAVDEGLLKLEDKPCDMFGEYMPKDADERWQEVTLFNLLTMSTGHGSPHLMAKDRKRLRGETENPADPAQQAEWLRFAFSRECPMVYGVGEKMRYGNLAPYVAGRMVEKVTGCNLREYLYEKLWKPLGVQLPRWDADPSGHTFAASDLFLDITDMIKLGEIYLGKGEYRGRRYVSEKWVEQASGNYILSNPINPVGNAVDEEQGYGFYFWRNTRPGYRAYGREGQFIIVLPEEKAVVATQAMNSDVQPIMDAIWEEIYPQLKG